MVTTTTPGGKRVSICTCTRTGRHLATFTRWPGSSPVAAPCSCRLLSHQTLLWHHRLGHPSLPRLCVRLHLRKRFCEDLPVLRLHSDRGGEFSSDLLRDFCRGEGILHHGGGLYLYDHAAAPHFLWSFAVRYAAHQLNLWPRVSLPETSPTLRWTGKVGDASVFRLWGSHAFVSDTSANKLSSRANPRIFLGFPPDAPGWQFYHPTSHRVLSSQDVTFDESVPFYRLFPNRSAPLPPPTLFLAPGPPPIDPLPPQGPAPSGVSQVGPLPLAEHVEVTVDSGVAGGGAARGAASGGADSAGAELEGAEPATAELGGVEPASAEPGGAEPEGAEPEGAETEGAERGGAESEGAESGGAEPRGTVFAGGPTGAGGHAAGGTGAGGAGATSPGGAGVTAGAGGTKGAGAAGPGGARTRGTGVAGVGGVGGARAGDLGAGGTGAGGAGAGGAGAGGTGAGDSGAGGTGAGDPRARDSGAGGTGAGDPGGGSIEARNPGAGGAGTGGAGVGGAGAGGTGAGGAGAGGTSARGAGAGGAGAGGTGARGTGAGDPGAGGAGVGGAGAGGTVAGGTVQRRPFFVPPPLSSLPPPGLVLCQPDSPLPTPSPYAEQTDSLTERREPESRPVSPVRVVCTGRRVPCLHPPPIPGTHIMALHPSSVPLLVPLWSPPASSLADGPDPGSDLVRAASPTVTRLLATVIIDPSFESAAASALVAELVDFAAA
ncbi:unnamed protein product [Closterium sp. NIES-54]